jgi:hypothetical protein
MNNQRKVAVSAVGIAAVVAVFAATPLIVAYVQSHDAQAFGFGRGGFGGFGHRGFGFGGFGHRGFGFGGFGGGFGGWGGGWGGWGGGCGGCCGGCGCGGWGW